MFGFSLPKILFTIAVIVAIWYGFKWLGRMQEQKNLQAKQQRKQAEKKKASKPVWGTSKDPAEEAEEMVQCKVCETFMPASGARSCGRQDCPYPG